MAHKFSNGAFVFARTSNASGPLTPLEIEHLCVQHALPTSLIPAYAGDRSIVSRAISANTPQLGKHGWLIRPINTSRSLVLYGIVQETKDQEQERLDHHFDAKLRWSSESGNGAHIEGQHAVAQQIDTTYQQLRGRIGPADWTDATTTYLLTECYAQAMRDDGRVYFCPAQALPKLYQFQTFLAAVGINLIICEVEAETRPIVQQAASEGLAEQLQALQVEVESFDGKQKPSTYKARIEAYQALRKRATVYKEALAIGVEQAVAILDALEAKVQAMLTLRESTVVRKDGAVVPVNGHTREAQYLSDLAAQGEEALTTALASGAIDVPALPSTW